MFCKINLNPFSLITISAEKKHIFNETIIIAKGKCWRKKTNKLLSIEKLYPLLHNSHSQMLSEIQGNYLILLINARKKLLKIITDQIASVPLYYHISKTQIQLSNNIDKLPSVSLNIKAINSYSKCGTIPPPSTIYKNIHKLEPGIYEFDNNNKLFSKKNHTFDEKRPLKEVLNKTLKNIETYAKKRKLAVLVTGGLDSSLLAALAKKMKPTLFFAAVDDNKTLQYNLSSIKKCKELSKYLKLPFKVIKVCKKTFLKNTKKTIRLLDEPLRDYDLPAVYSLFEGISKQIPSACIISGIGSNELFNLPKKYLEIYLNKKIPIEINIHKKLAKNFGLIFYTPYLNEELISFAMNTPLIKRKGKVPLKKETMRTKILPKKYIMQQPQHSEIPDTFLNQLKKIYGNYKLLSFADSFFPESKISPEIKNDFLLKLWINQKYH